MTAAELVCRLSECGYKFTLVGDNIVLKHIGGDEPKAEAVLPLVDELKQNKPEVIRYLKDKQAENSSQGSIEDIERLKIACIVAHELLMNADKVYCRALDVSRQTLDQVVRARRDFDAVRSRLLSEITCNEIQSYFKDLDVGKD